MPMGPGTRGEVDVAGADTGGVRRTEKVAVDVAGKPVGWALERVGAVAEDFHNARPLRIRLGPDERGWSSGPECYQPAGRYGIPARLPDCVGRSLIYCDLKVDY